MNPFESLVQRYDRWYEGEFGSSAYSLELECIRSMMGEFSLGLEVGVGTGRFASAFGVQVGLDPSMSMLRLAKRRGILCVQGVGESMPFRDGSFDLILMVVTVCFVKDPYGVLRESRRVLKERGKLLMGLILRESPWADFYTEKGRQGHPIYRHARFYSMEEVENMLTKAGFRIASVRSTIIEQPQDERAIKNKEIREGFHKTAGFTCILAT